MAAFKQVLLHKICLDVFLVPEQSYASYASAVSFMYDILVKFSVVVKCHSFKGHSAGQKLNINEGFLIVHQLTMNFD